MIHRFDNCELDTEMFELRRKGEVVPVQPQVFELLRYLVENRDRMVTRDELFSNVWSGRLVSDTALSSRIRAARRAIDDDGVTQRLIRTVHGRGFRFVGDVRDEPPVEKPKLEDLAAVSVSASNLSDLPSIAVLPFINKSGDPAQQYFSDGIAEDITTGLSHFRELLVIGRNTSFSYKDENVQPHKVGRELGVRYVLEGSVRRAGEKVRVAAQLVDTQSNVHIWGDRYDGSVGDVFALQDEITAQVLSTLGSEITLAEIKRTRSKRSENIDAWDRYLQALPAFYAVDLAGYETAERLLFEAIEIDREFALGHATLSRLRVNAAYHGWEERASTAVASAEKHARRAIVLDQREPQSHVASGSVHILKTQSAKAVNDLHRALELNPNLTVAHGLLSIANGFLGLTEESLEAAARAQLGSPRDPESYWWCIGVMNAYFASERYEKAVAAAEQALLLQPNFYGGYAGLAYCLPYLGRIEEARDAVDNLQRVMPRLTLKSARRNPLFAKDEDVARMLEALHMAGLPD